jgi:hypothetical protein
MHQSWIFVFLIYQPHHQSLSLIENQGDGFSIVLLPSVEGSPVLSLFFTLAAKLFEMFGDLGMVR